jgi:hypothetical protein
MRNLTLALALGLLTACGSAPGSGIGATCSATQKCDGLTCDLSAAGGYCTKFCNTSGSTSECPDGSVCDASSGLLATSCVKICLTDTTCRTDQGCSGVSGSNIKGCKPK